MRRGGAGATAAGPAVVVTFALLAPALTAPARADFALPAGLTLTYQTELSYGKSPTDESSDRIFENWLNADYTRGPVTAGLRYVAFSPPDPAVFDQGPDSHGIDFAYGELNTRRVQVRGGSFYALFGRGLALRAYENRPLRVDNNLLGGRATGTLPGGEVTAVLGRSVEGNAEDADRGRTEAIGGVDVEHRLPLGFTAGGSFVTTEVPSQGTARLEPQRLKAARLGRSVAGVDLYAEAARVDGPATIAGAAAPNVHGHGLYAVATTAVGRLGLLAEYKDYDRLRFDNAAGQSYILPPAALREHQYNLLNRHPHQLDPRDEVGFQLEATYNTERLSSRGMTSFIGNWSRTRNHDDRQLGNHFDDAYLEVQQELGNDNLAIAGLSYQRSFDSPETPDPLLTLLTPLADVRFRIGERYGLHLQLEHQHTRADRLGEFDTEFVVVEWSRSPDLTASFLAEVTNKSEVQLASQGERDTRFFAGEVSYHFREQHEITLFGGARNAGFVCVGGVCRYEPAFDGAELRLVTRF
jgi:hypothetical protein